MSKYEAELAVWESTEVGEKYKQQVASQKNAMMIASAKARFLDKKEKKPANALKTWMSENQAAVQRDNPELQGRGPLLAKLKGLWSDLSSQDKQVWLDKAKQAMDLWKQRQEDWMNSPDGKKYRSVINRVNRGRKGGGKGKTKANAKGLAIPQKPERMPKKPRSGYMIFKMEKRQAGVNKFQINKDWMDLGAEGQKKYHDDSKERAYQYERT